MCGSARKTGRGSWVRLARGRITHQNHAALSADESDPDRLAGEAARQSNDGGSSQGFGYTARHYLNDVLLPTGLLARQLISAGERLRTQPFPALRTLFRRRWQGDMDLPPQPLIPYADW